MFWWCLVHSRVEDDEQKGRGESRLGPYATHAEAERALQTVRERNDRLDEEDRRWVDEGLRS